MYQYIRRFMMDIRFVTFLLALDSADSVYIRSREPGRWFSARENCQAFGGSLATLIDLDTFRTEVASGQTSLEPGEDLWVGAFREQTPWIWHGEENMPFNEDGIYYTRRGCMELPVGAGGTKVDALTPQKCGQICNWDGVFGLQNDVCVCSRDLVNVSKSEPGVCHIPCQPPSTDICGGYTAVSVYKPENRNISWAKEQDEVNYDCAFLRKSGKLSGLQFVSAHCSMRSRYICTFTDDDKCGVSSTCIRWSTVPETWDGAKESCLAMNGSLAILGGPSVRQQKLDLDRLPVGGFWVSLRRNPTWRWINGKEMSVSWQKSRVMFGDDKNCATVQRTVYGAIEISADKCENMKYFLCQYDYMKKRAEVDIIPAADTVRSDGTLEYGEVTPFNESDVTDSPKTVEENNGLIFTCMYMILGFVSGMVCVLIIGFIVYIICRCRQPSHDKHTRLIDHSSGSRQDVHSVIYSSKNESVRITPPHSDIMYDTVYDLGAESPFRRTQRLIRMGSANAWRTPPRRATGDVCDSPRPNYTWRGIIGGDVEVINTELRQQSVNQLDFHNAFDTCNVSVGAVGGPSSKHAAGPEDFDRIDDLYDLPERSDSFDYERRVNRVVDSRRYVPAVEDISFLEFHAARNSTDLNDENIYATIKKTFQKIKEDLA